MANRNVILHVNNYALMGGVESLVLDFSVVFPQFQHILITINSNNEQQSFYKYIQNRGIKYFNAGDKLTEAMVAEIDPLVTFFHNTKGTSIEGEWPYRWLNPYRIVAVHHAPTQPCFYADADWFVSQYVRKNYKKIEDRMPCAFTMPPCVWERPYVGIERPMRKPVVGRIQSSTNTRHGKVPEDFFNLLEQVNGCDFFVVTTNGIAEKNKRRAHFKFAPIVPGMMPKYLERADVFAIWGETKETWSRVVTEANLSGIPVVARNHNDGLAEQIRLSGGGVLVNSKKGFIENVQAFVDDSELRQSVGERGRRWCLGNASSKTLKQRFLEPFLEWGVN